MACTLTIDNTRMPMTVLNTTIVLSGYTLSRATLVRRAEMGSSAVEEIPAVLACLLKDGVPAAFTGTYTNNRRTGIAITCVISAKRLQHEYTFVFRQTRPSIGLLLTLERAMDLLLKRASDLKA
jgi:hypothetical protein